MSTDQKTLLPREPSMTLVQIVELYKDRYVSLATAKDLANRHVPELAKTIRWSSLMPRETEYSPIELIAIS